MTNNIATLTFSLRYAYETIQGKWTEETIRYYQSHSEAIQVKETLESHLPSVVFYIEESNDIDMLQFAYSNKKGEFSWVDAIIESAER
jgi:hypothetical protein